MLSRRVREMRQRRSDIIRAAKELFLQKDYEDVSMREIAYKAEFTRRTLYSYFKSKLDLVTIIILDSLVELDKILAEEVSKKTLSYERIFTYGKQQYLFYINNPSYYKLIHYFDIAIHNAECKLSPEVMHELENLPTGMDELFFNILESGVQDGTFREDLNIALAKDFFSKAWYGIIHQYILHPQHPERSVYTELEYLIGGLMRK